MFGFDSKTGFHTMPILMPRPLLFRGLSILGFLLAAAGRAAEAPAATPVVPVPAAALIQATDLLKLKQLSAPALSPDGKWVVYAVRSAEPAPGAGDDWVSRTHLWLAATDGSAPPRQLTRGDGDENSPVWNPTGDKIGFVSGRPGAKPQIHLLAPVTGDEVELTQLAMGAGRPRWSPDGSTLLFTSDLSYADVRTALEKSGAESKPKWKTERPGRTVNDTANPGQKIAAGNTPNPGAALSGGSLAERREWLARNEAGANPRVLDRLNFSGEADLMFTHVFTQEARPGAEAKDLTPGYASYAAPEWRPDGKGIVCAGPRKLDEHPDRDRLKSLYVIDASSGGAKLLAELADYSLGDPHPSPDGKLVALTATPGEAIAYGQAIVATVPSGGGEVKLLSAKLDRDVRDLRWSSEGKFLYFTAPNNGGLPLYKIAAEGGEAQRVTPSETDGVCAYDLGAHGFVQVLTSPANPSELYSGLPGKTEGTCLTRHNDEWLAEKKLGAYEGRSLVNKEGLTIRYWILKPVGFDPAKKYPLLLEIHDGPDAMGGPGANAGWFELQYFAARGYVVVFANPRGATGSGRDFQRANHQDWAIGPAGDVLAALEFVAKEPYIARYRQVVTGRGYGAYLTAWIVGHEHRFKAAVARDGAYDLASFFEETAAWQKGRRAFDGYPWEEAARGLMEHESPLTSVENITTPLLFAYTEGRPAAGQSELLLRSLKILGHDAEAVRYPRVIPESGSEDGPGPAQRIDALVRTDEFFRRFIGEN